MLFAVMTQVEITRLSRFLHPVTARTLCAPSDSSRFPSFYLWKTVGATSALVARLVVSAALSLDRVMHHEH